MLPNLKFHFGLWSQCSTIRLNPCDVSPAIQDGNDSSNSVECWHLLLLLHSSRSLRRTFGWIEGSGVIVHPISFLFPLFNSSSLTYLSWSILLTPKADLLSLLRSGHDKSTYPKSICEWMMKWPWRLIIANQELKVSWELHAMTMKTCWWITWSVVEALDASDDQTQSDTMTWNNNWNEGHEESNVIIKYKKGIDQIQTMINLGKTLQKDSSPHRFSRLIMQQGHSMLSLHLLAITSSILSQSFHLLLLQSLYPVLHFLTSPHTFIASTAQATLCIITATAYASRQCCY